MVDSALESAGLIPVSWDGVGVESEDLSVRARVPFTLHRLHPSMLGSIKGSLILTECALRSIECHGPFQHEFVRYAYS